MIDIKKKKKNLLELRKNRRKYVTLNPNLLSTPMVRACGTFCHTLVYGESDFYVIISTNF